MKNRSVRNQRVSNSRQRRQQHLLEVTVRHDKAVAMRNRAIVMFCFKAILVCGLVAGLYVGGKEALRRFLWENPDYFLTDIRVSTDGTLTREQVLTAAGIVEGRNIFTVDLDKAQENIASLAQVERVEVQRVLPNRVNIGIVERHPIAWVTAKAEEDPTTSEKSFLIDSRGIVMRSKSVASDYLHLPVISGVEVENLAPGQRVLNVEMQSALELVRLNADSTGFQARNIDLSKGYCLVVTDRTHAKITFGLDRVDLQLERLNQLLDHLDRNKREIQTVNLLVERNVPVTFVDPNAPVSDPESMPPKPEPSHSAAPKPGPGGKGAAVAPATTVRPATAVSANTPKGTSGKPRTENVRSSESAKAKEAPKPTPVQRAQPVNATKPAVNPVTPAVAPASRPVPSPTPTPGRKPVFPRNPFRING